MQFGVKLNSEVLMVSWRDDDDDDEDDDDDDDDSHKMSRVKKLT